MANPCLRPRFTSDIPTESRCPRFAAARSNIAPITSGPASHGCSSCGKTLRTTTYPSHDELGLNGSFAVFKKVETDVVGFEDFLQSNKDKIDPELLAAKMCGRWRNGVPLALSPDTDSPAGGISPEQLNNFGYVDADGSGDPKGIRCPVGAHIRRVNPRGQPVAGQGVPGGSNNSHRLIRRGLPYGPTYDPSKPYDGIERGMLFHFINSNIENQYEFVLRQWVNDSEFAGAVRLHPKSKDPLIGTQNPAESIFVIPQANGAPPIEVTGLSSFVTTKAAAYVFLPSITAIKFIANLGEGRVIRRKYGSSSCRTPGIVQIVSRSDLKGES